MTKFGILGTGDVGKNLGRGLVKHGHEVFMGSREKNNEKAAQWAKEVGPKAHQGTFEDAAKFGEIVIIATAWPGTENALKLAGHDNLKGKVVIDATNPLKHTATGIELEIGFNNSGGETVQKWIPHAHVVKAFNIVGSYHMVDPQFPGGKPDMFIAANDAGAKKTVTELLKTIGWDVVDSGDITSARLLEPLCLLWLKYAFATQPPTFNHAFKLLKN